MDDKDLVTLLDREVETLSAENNDSAAALMRTAAARIRRMIPLGPPKGE